MTLQNFIKAFEALRAQFKAQRGFGAQDTEPMCVLRGILRRMSRGKDFQVPETANGWELYSDKPGAELAAGKLRAAVSNLREAHDKLTMAEVRSQTYKDLMGYYG